MTTKVMLKVRQARKVINSLLFKSICSRACTVTRKVTKAPVIELIDDETVEGAEKDDAMELDDDDRSSRGTKRKGTAANKKYISHYR